VAILGLTATPFSIQAFIGCIILAGIVVNNAIVLIDYINRLRREQAFELSSAIEAAGVRRLRPILMTTLTTGLGLLPLSMGLGEGGEAQAPMARVVVGGLLASTMITLVLIPVIYSIVEQRSGRHSTEVKNIN
jgi:HAE1 family hydrophobic/amphiphilic exporter-1